MIGNAQALSVLVDCLRPNPVGAVETPAVAPDWMTVLGLANEEMLSALLWSVMRGTDRAAALPESARNYLAMIHGLNERRNRVLRRQMLELLGAFNSEGIRPAPLKGGLSLLDGLYGDPAARMMCDIDILVPHEVAGVSIEVLQGLGYRIACRYPIGHHAFGDFARPDDPCSVDLHFELVDPSHVLPASEVWERAKPMRIGRIRYFAPSGTDRVLHNLLHAQIHYLGNFYRGDLQLLQLYEFAALSRQFGEGIDWLFVEERMRAHKLTTALESYVLAAHDLFGLEWPLAKPASFSARMHYRRCRAQLRVRALKWLGVPWGNLRGAFAWHRMRALYGTSGGPLRWRCRHVAGYVRKSGFREPFARLFR